MSGIRIGESEGVMVARIDRAEKANALTIAMQAELAAALSACEDRAEIAGTVIWGGDGTVFSSGADIRETDPAASMQAFADRRSRQLFDLLRCVLRHPKPVIVAINGHAIGSGCLLAMAADRRIAVAGASLRLPEIRLGQPTFAGAAVLAHLANRSIAADLVQTGRHLTMEEAVRLGLVHVVTDSSELLARACAAASELAAHPDAFARNKRWLNDLLIGDLDRAEAASAEARAARFRKAAEDEESHPDRTRSDSTVTLE